MRYNIAFIALLVLLTALSWADVFIFGTARTNLYPYLLNQIFHLAVYVTAFLGGYFFWKSGPLRLTWLFMYGAGTMLLAAGVLVVYFYPKHAGHSNDFASVVAKLRNTLSGPLPLLTFYIFRELLRSPLVGKGGPKV